MDQGPTQWYGPENQALRQASAAGYLHEAQSKLPFYPNFDLRVNDPSQEKGDNPRAFSNSSGFINIPDIGNQGGGYFSKPQYLAEVVAHEAAHNSDWRNKPKVPHSIETFRPLEAAASKAAGIEPQYNPGTDTGVGGINEYADSYKDLKTWVPHFYLSANQMNPSKQVYPVSLKNLAKALANKKAIQKSGNPTYQPYKPVAGAPQGFMI